MTFARSLAPTTQQTYRPVSPEEIETWLNDELAKGLAPPSRGLT